MGMTNFDMTVIYYTSNYLEEHNPYFVANTKKQLLKAIGDYPLVIVSQKDMKDDVLMDRPNSKNIVIGDIGRHHLNIYKQILIGCKEAKTEHVALAEDDIFYSYEHFHTYAPPHNKFAFDMSKVSLFTWTKPPMYSFRNKRRVVNHLIARRDMLVEAMEERFERVKELQAEGKGDDFILPRFGDPGRYEARLGVTPRISEEFYTTCPGIVLTHPDAYGYLNHGKRKRIGDLRIIELQYWGRASDMLNLWRKDWKTYEHK